MKKLTKMLELKEANWGLICGTAIIQVIFYYFYFVVKSKQCLFV